MRFSLFIGASLFALALAGCVTHEKVSFSAGANQTAIVRDGRPALISRKKSSIVLVGPSSRQVEPGGRPVFIVAVNNLTSQPSDLKIASIEVNQITASGSRIPLQVITYEQLVQEEKTRQVIGALLVGAASAANSYSAARSGYGSYQGTAYSSRGTTVNFSGTYYSPTANAINQMNAQAQNEAMIANTIARGQANMGVLERDVLKDNTVMPGEWIGGQLHFAPPLSNAQETKNYTISISFAGDVHDIEVTQGIGQN